jgi:hypothetical protein
MNQPAGFALALLLALPPAALAQDNTQNLLLSFSGKTSVTIRTLEDCGVE